MLWVHPKEKGVRGRSNREGLVEVETVREDPIESGVAPRGKEAESVAEALRGLSWVRAKEKGVGGRSKVEGLVGVETVRKESVSSGVTPREETEPLSVAVAGMGTGSWTANSWVDWDLVFCSKEKDG